VANCWPTLTHDEVAAAFGAFAEVLQVRVARVIVWFHEPVAVGAGVDALDARL
jgi:hypothetical protein